MVFPSINDALPMRVHSQNLLHYLNLYSMHLMLHILKGISCLLPAECLFLFRRNTFYPCWSPYWCCLKGPSFRLDKTKSSFVLLLPLDRRRSYHNYYRPQRSWGKVMFYRYLTRYTPPDQVPPGTWYTPRGPRTPPRPGTPPRTRYTPWTRYPPGPGTPPGDHVHPPWDQVHPPRPGTPRDQVHPPWGPRTPPGDQVHPPGPGYTPWTRYPPRTRYTPPGPGTSHLDQVPPQVNSNFLIQIFFNSNFFFQIFSPEFLLKFFFQNYFSIFNQLLYHHPPPPPRAREIRSTRGQYTSYWNAFLFIFRSAFFVIVGKLPTEVSDHSLIILLYCVL